MKNMIRSPRKGPPKHLEKMLFINHKEDMLLQDRLADLNLKSKLRIMDLDREQIQVRRELRNSRKKNIDVRNSIQAANIINVNNNGVLKTEIGIKPVKRKHAISAPPGGRPSSVDEGSPTVEQSGSVTLPVRRSSVNRFTRETSLPDIRESIDEDDDLSDDTSVKDVDTPKWESPREKAKVNVGVNGRSRTNSVIIDESVGAYVLGEFRRMSQVVPSILRALKNKNEEEEEELSYTTEPEQPVNLLEYEPDLHKVTKTVSVVKKLRHRMSVSKKLDAARPIKPLDQMIREKTETLGMQDEYTDGACVLMKRRLDKKRRNSASPGLGQPTYMQRRQSLFAKPNIIGSRRQKASPTVAMFNIPRQRNRSQSLYNWPKMSRSHTVMGLTSPSKLDNEFDSPVIDEDEFINRQKILRELDNYRRIRVKVGEFLAAHDSRRAQYSHVYAI